MAWSVSRAELRDPFGGRDDLAARRIRAVGNASRRIEEDRLRALRAIRFAARFDFTIDDATWRAIADSAPALTRLSVERVLQEWIKTLEQVRCPSTAFAQWRSSGALSVLVPSLDVVPDEYFIAVDHVPRGASTSRPDRRALRLLTRLALPFLPLGAAEARAALVALRASNHDAAHAAALAEAWVTCGADLERIAAGTVTSPAELRRIVSRIGRVRVLGTIRACAAVWAARRASGHSAPSLGQAQRLARHMVRMAFSDPVALGDLAVDGDDLRRAGMRPGPLLGRILHRLLDRVLDDPMINTHDQLLVLARAMAEDR
jgi:tRNA nucleotidyltransferase (CCA-adding enzyme)